MQNLETIRELINLEINDYQKAKENSQLIDQKLNFKISEAESNIIKDDQNQTWSHLDAQIFQTPYTELKEMISHIDVNDKNIWVDLGAAYGRMGIVLHIFRPAENFIGFESEQSRVFEGKRIYSLYKIKNSELVHQDLQDINFKMPNADIFFIYDYGKKEHIYKTLHQLSEIAKGKSIKLFARGLGVRHYIMNDFPWLWTMNEAKHTEHWSLFQS